MPPRPIALSAALVLATIAAGLAIRFAQIGLPHTVTKYGGSALWALLFYGAVSSLLPSSIPRAALLTVALTTAVEFFKLFHAPAVDAFRHTLPGILLLGRIFSPWDILAYLVAIAVGASVDARLRG